MELARKEDITGHLIGRSTERSTGSDRLLLPEAASAAVLITGEAGIGKTALVEELTAEARSAGFAVLRARPVEAESLLSYSGLIDLFSETPARYISELPAPQRTAIEVALKQREAQRSSRDPLAVSMSVLSVLRRLAETSTVLVVVDDLQWLDGATERALAYALRRQKEGLRILFAAREELRPPLFDEVSQELDDELVKEVHLGPLSSAALHQIFKEALDVNFTRPILVKIEQASGGNPFFALEIARAIAGGRIDVQPGRPLAVPKDLTVLVAERLASLSGDARQLLLSMAAAGEMTRRLASHLLGDSAEGAIRESVDGSVIEEAGDRLRFTHPLLTSAVYARAEVEEIRNVHLSLAGLTDDVERRAVHIALGGAEAEEAEKVLEEAAAHALSRGAPEVAVELLQLACGLTHEAPSSLQRKLADALFRAGDASQAEATLDRLVATLPRGRERSRALVLSAAVAYETAGTERCVALCEQGLEEAGDDPALQARLYATLAASTSDDIAKAASYSATAIELLTDTENPDVDSLCLALVTAVENQLTSGGGFNAELMDRALALEPESSLRVSDRPSAAYGTILKYNDDYQEARHWLDRAKKSIEEEGDEGGIPFVLSHYPQLELWSGNLHAARSVALEHVAFAEKTGQAGQRAQGLFNLSLAEAHIGNIEEAVSAARAALDLAEELDDIYFVGLANWGLGSAYIHAGDPARALPPLSTATEIRERVGFKDPGRWRFYGEYVEALLSTKDVDGADQEAQRLLERSLRVDRVSGLATGYRSAALVAAARRELDAAAELLSQAEEIHGRWGNPFERARTLLAAGQIARRRKAKTEAKLSLSQAQEIFTSVGARLWAERTKGEIDRLGLRPTAPSELTVTEKKVAQLAASGLTNKDVAASLFISPKTVEANLAKVYRKLGIGSRAELGARLGGTSADE